MFTTGWDPFQVLINVGTFSRAGHAAIGVGDMLLHAYEKGVVYEPREQWFTSKKQRLVAEVEIVPDVSLGLRECFSRVGEPYDVVGVFRAALAITMRRFVSSIQWFGPASRDSHTCAAFVMLLDPDGARIPEWRALDRAIVTPADLLAMTSGPSFQPRLSEL